MSPRIVLKRLLILGGAAAAFVVLLAVVVPLLVSGETVRTKAVQAIAEATGATVELGEARVAVLPRLAVRLRQGTVAGDGAGLRKAQGDDFGVASYAADLDEVIVRVSVMPLLKREIQVDEVTLVAPRLDLVREGHRLQVEGARLTLHDLRLPAEALPAPAAEAPPGELLPAGLSCGARLQAASVAWDKARWQDVTASARLERRIVTVERAEANLGGGSLKGQAVLDYAADPWGRVQFAAEAADVDAGALLGPWSADLGRRLEGALTAEVAGGCALRDAAAVRASLDLEGRVTAGDGVLHAGDWLRDVSPYLGQRQDLKDIRFTSLDHAFKVKDGRWLVDRLVLDGGETRWQAGGAVGLDGILDLDVQVKLPPGFTPDLGQWSFLADTLRDQDGRVQLDLTLTGRAASPAVGLDLSQLQKNAADGGADALKKGVGSLLDKWKSK